MLAALADPAAAANVLAFRTKHDPAVNLAQVAKETLALFGILLGQVKVLEETVVRRSIARNSAKLSCRDIEQFGSLQYWRSS